jgi:hypothetical protein
VREPARALPQPAHLIGEPVCDQLAAVQFRVIIAIGVFRGRPARRPQLTQRRVQLTEVGGGHDLVHPRGREPGRGGERGMDTPSARADASTQLRSRSACSSRHAARSSTRRSRRHTAVRSAIFMHTACPACTVQQSGHAGGSDDAVLYRHPDLGRTCQAVL